MTTPLPPPDPDTADERLPGEAELAALYRQLPPNVPSAALDAAVLQAAAQAAATGRTQPEVPLERRRTPRESGDWVHPRPVAATPNATRRHHPRWLFGLSTAATLLLAGGLAWHLHEAPQPESRAMPAPTTAADMAPPSTETETAAPALTPAPPAPAPSRQPPPRVMAAKMQAAPAAPPASFARPSSVDKKTSPLPLRQPQAAVAARAPASIPSENADRAPAGADAPAMMSDTSTGAAPAMAAPPAPMEELAVADTAPDANDTPVQELEKIRQLFAQGHEREAGQRLAAFHLAHPQAELPPDLQAKLRKP